MKIKRKKFLDKHRTVRDEAFDAFYERSKPIYLSQGNSSSKNSRDMRKSLFPVDCDKSIEHSAKN